MESNCGIAGHAFGQQFRVRVLARVAIVQTALVGEDQQQIRLDEIGHQRRQGVVVAKTDFLGGDGVIFIDDGNHAETQQGAQAWCGC